MSHRVSNARPQDTAQPALFDRDAYLQSRTTRAVQHRHSSPYERWWCSEVHYRQRYEVLIYQQFRCWECGYLLDPRWFDTHHTTYDNLGYEEATDLVAVHRRCHRRIEERRRREEQEQDTAA
jgi:hypothetical protein